ncbi:hypothetical protein jhhlp_008846 [Lomentospora prolificans]|uniref:Uncharacterized protein n=1 Tax=Lomentospora prolificans TaxID=41688 RepID=A0A2N3MZ72_9PEZI|nr:hypothetical protein jhhlp_008846 [Lomentospora prolificans]
MRDIAHQQELLGGGDSLDMVFANQGSSDVVDINFVPGSRIQRPSATSLLMRFGENLEQRVSAMGIFLSNPRNIIDDCAEDAMAMEAENPVAVAITSTKEFIDIIQDLTVSTPFTPSSSLNQLISPVASLVSQPENLSTEVTLLILSNYLRLMRLYDSLFHDAHRCLCQISAETIKSIKVKAAFRIGGMSSQQDIPGKVYAKGITDVIKSHIQTLERCMGLPAAYCLSSEATESPNGIFADADRAQLLHTVMAQEDVKSLKGNKSYVESIRENIENTIAFFGN